MCDCRRPPPSHETHLTSDRPDPDETSREPLETRFLAGGGEMGACMRAYDWAATPLGPPRAWPQSLRTALRILLTTNHPMFIWWGPGLIQFYNDAYRQTMGPERHPSALGQEGRECWAEIWDIIGPQIDLVMSGKGATWHEDQLVPVTRHGRREDVWWTYGYSPIEDAAGVGGVLVVCNDVTEQHRAKEELQRLNEVLEERVRERTRALQESEERARHLYDRTPMALHSVDRNARLIDVNDQWLHLFGYSREEVIGRSPTEFMVKESARRYRENAFPELVGSGSEVRVVDYRFVKRDGRQFDGRLSARAERDAEGRFVRSWSATIDITAQKEAEELLRQAQKMEAVGQLTSGLAHDFNNLLTAASGGLELAGARTQDPRTQRHLQMVMRAIDRGAELTQQLLAFARKQHLAPRPVDANRLVLGMGDMLARTIGPTIEIHHDLVEGPWPALIDPNQVEVALLNLVLNARDAMPAGGVLRIETANIPARSPRLPEEVAASDCILVAVSDTGSGMNQAVLARAFEPFFTTKSVGKGSGLGLSMVFGVARQSGGTVRMRSRVGEGTTVELYLPRAAALAVARSDDAAPSPQRVDGTRILVVDDDPHVRELIVDYLREIGHVVAEAASGAEAMALLERGDPYDLLLTDVGLPGMAGSEVARLARAARPGIKVLYMTGYADAATFKDEAHGHPVIKKPFRLAALAAAVIRVIESPPPDIAPTAGTVAPASRRSPD